MKRGKLRLEAKAFLAAGKTIKIKLHPGSYEIRHASGTVWYGEKIKFGPETVYTKLDTVARLTRRTVRKGRKRYIQTSNVQITLIKQIGGNLTSTKINKDGF